MLHTTELKFIPLTFLRLTLKQTKMNIFQDLKTIFEIHINNLTHTTTEPC